VAVDVAGALCVTGDTQSAESSFPVKIGPDLTYNGNVDCFVAKVRPDGTGLVYCGYIGGANRDVGVGIGVDSQGNACVGGTTSSDETTFPVLDPFDATANGGDDLFVARVSPSGALLFSGFVGGANDEETRAATADAAGNVYLWGFTGSTQTDGFPLLTGPDLTHNGNDDCFIAKVGATTSAPADVVESFFLPKRIVATQDAKTPAKSKLIAAGFFDLGPDEPDLTKSATLDVGGFSFAIPGLTLKGKNYVYAQPGMDFTVFTNPARSSRARFRVRTTGDLTGKVDLNGPLTLKFTSGDVNGATGLVNLTAGRYAIGRIRGALVKPNLYLSLVKAVVKGGGKDSLTTVLGLATNGVTPAAASDFTLQFGATYAATIPAASFVKKGDKFVFKGSAGGVTSATLDYLRETITVNAKNVDLGTYAPGGNSVLVSVGLGAAQHAVRVRMVRTGRAMKY
jgi:hypothetical protein